MENHEITLSDGTNVMFTHINQCPTYDGWLEGLPTVRMNKRICKKAVSEAKELFNTKRAYLIEPKEERIERNEKYFLGRPAKIPMIKVIARIKSLDPVDPKCIGYSHLPVVWFQNSFAFPISEEAQEGIKAIKWSENAIDWEY